MDSHSDWEQAIAPAPAASACHAKNAVSLCPGPLDWGVLDHCVCMYNHSMKLPGVRRACVGFMAHPLRARLVPSAFLFLRVAALYILGPIESTHSQGLTRQRVFVSRRCLRRRRRPHRGCPSRSVACCRPARNENRSALHHDMGTVSLVLSRGRVACMTDAPAPMHPLPPPQPVATFSTPCDCGLV